MAQSHEQIQAMTDEEIIERYNAVADQTTVGLNWWQDELHRRHLSRQAKQIQDDSTTLRQLTWMIAILTMVVTVATIVNVLAISLQ